MDSVVRFFALYFTTLFSLDTVSAAANSPFRHLRTNSENVQNPIQPRRRDYGEGEGIGFRLDAGGPTQRRGGFGPGGGSAVNIPTCGACATPQIS
jgi:hypothetical protein